MSSLNPWFPLSAVYTSVGVSVYRLLDRTTYDFATTGSTPQRFTTAAVTTKFFALAADTNNEPDTWAGQIPTTGLTASNQFADGWYAMYAWDTSGATPVRIAYTSPFYVANGDDIYAPTSGSSGQSGDVFALLNPMVATSQFTADALANAPAAGGLATGLVVAGSTAHIVRVSGYPAGQVYKGQQLWHISTNVCRFIQDQSYASPNYFLILGTGIYGAGTGLDADLPATPTAGDVVAIIP